MKGGRYLRGTDFCNELNGCGNYPLNTLPEAEAVKEQRKGAEWRGKG